MDIIRLLPDRVANQIAAGEVVQRPSSVIKELLENSVDAGATDVQVILRDAGRELIQVIDNGKGMSPTDARMAFERHATSKISTAADLFALRTMGFRGEALASICAVAEVELRTRRADDEAGVLIAIAGSRLVRQETVACPAGANFAVRNLFYNVPARRKFLKSNQTELSNIITELQHVALANPEVAFTLTHNDQLQFRLSAGNHRQRITQLFAKTIGQQLLPVSMDNEMLAVHGFVGDPDGARRKGALQFFFVNDRYMRHPYFHKAVLECYEGLIPADAQPNYFIYLTVDPSTIDVNIHPTKTEIKFENEAARWHILMATVREALGKYNAVPTIDFDTADAPDIAVLPSRGGTAAQPSEPRPQFDSTYNPFRRNPALSHWETLYDDFRSEPAVLTGGAAQGAALETATPDAAEEETLVSRLDQPDHHPVLPLPMAGGPDDAAAAPRLFQVAGRYIAQPRPDGLLLYDQRRAHLCVLFDRYMQQMGRRQGASQQELFPEIVEIPPADVPHLEAILPELEYLGFRLDCLGGGSYAVSGKPTALGSHIQLRTLLLQMVEAAREEVHAVGEQLERKLALRLAQAQAITAGRQLSPDEMRRLVDDLLALPAHDRTPDGKPVATLLAADEIEQRLK